MLVAAAFVGWQVFGGADDASSTAATDGGESAGGAEGSDDAEGGTTDQPPAGVPTGVAPAFAQTGTPGMGNGIGSGEADAPVVVELFEDFMCPHCAAYEAQTAEQIAAYVESGDVRVVRYPMTLTPFGRPTELAANAYACAADAGRADEFAAVLFEANGTIWDNDRLTQAGAGAGLDGGDFADCVNEGRFDDWVATIDSTGHERGVTGTPTVFVNGEQVPLGTTPLEDLETAVEAALSEN